ncbi:M15 family metallopeptidase [Kibdelosporangium philippinense]|uniref:M15 family metallopeptidase n=1 Tax=Kibdelosporangium philippinense TaxID=211113 RepID=A0ABS8ZE14_9PSEU|nr:M15 family metallopeptidase [Kibdelosporangium philippinense]MCE7006079.1 M15 family metallopeptidase [Kibdelosporangium philippinense]
MDGSKVGRRLFLAGVAGGVAATWTAGVPALAAEVSGMSQNGWAVQPQTAGALASHRIEGSNASVTLLSGAVATVLLHVARRFNYEIGTLQDGDVTGYTAAVSGVPFESNYRSGTAIAIKPACYPAGARGNLFPHEIAAVRDILAECEGVVRWGGDDKKTPKEGHFQIDVPQGSAALARVAGKIAGWDSSAGQGAGVPADVFAPARRKAANELATRQAG